MKNKRFVKTLALLLVMVLFGAASAHAQVFIMDENNDNRNPTNTPVTPMIPTQDITLDQYAPIDGGLFLLCGMGIAFALSKRKKED